MTGFLTLFFGCWKKDLLVGRWVRVEDSFHWMTGWVWGRGLGKPIPLLHSSIFSIPLCWIPPATEWAVSALTGRGSPPSISFLSPIEWRVLKNVKTQIREAWNRRLNLRYFISLREPGSVGYLLPNLLNFNPIPYQEVVERKNPPFLKKEKLTFFPLSLFSYSYTLRFP